MTSLRPLLPFLVWLALLGGLDQALLITLQTNARPIEQQFRDYADQADPARPHLIVLGSSRAEDGLPQAILQAAVEDAGLPHQAFNLAVGGGGTPAYMYSALKDGTQALSGLPEGSKVVYLISTFEMNFLKPTAMRNLPTGRALLEQYAMMNMDHWAYRLKDHSGFARFAYGREWQALPFKLFRILEDSTAPVSLTRHAVACNGAGLFDYTIMPINDDALGRLSDAFKEHFILASPPVSQVQIDDDQRYGLSSKGEAYLHAFANERHHVYEPTFGPSVALPADAFAANCDHLRRDSDKRIFADAVIELLK